MRYVTFLVGFQKKKKIDSSPLSEFISSLSPKTLVTLDEPLNPLERGLETDQK